MKFTSDKQFYNTLIEVLEIINRGNKDYKLPEQFFKAYLGDGKFVVTNGEWDSYYKLIDNELKYEGTKRWIYSEGRDTRTKAEIFQSKVNDFIKYPYNR